MSRDVQAEHARGIVCATTEKSLSWWHCDTDCAFVNGCSLLREKGQEGHQQFVREREKEMK